MKKLTVNVLIVLAMLLGCSAVGDLDNDCTVNNNDLQIMTDVWLGQQPTLTPPIIQLDTTGLSAGPLITWVNSGTLGGAFTANPLDANTVVVSSPEVPAPVAVRYAYHINPEGCNLYNKEGLPASPFRTDDW